MLLGDAGWEDRVAGRGGRRPRAGGGEAPKRRRFLLLAPVRIDSVRYRKVKELSRIKSLLPLCIHCQKFGRRFPLPRGQVPKTTRDKFLIPRHQKFPIPRASPAPTKPPPVPKTTSFAKVCRFLKPRVRIARRNRAMLALRTSPFAPDSPSGAESGLDPRLRPPLRFLKPRAQSPVRSTDRVGFLKPRT